MSKTKIAKDVRYGRIRLKTFDKKSSERIEKILSNTGFAMGIPGDSQMKEYIIRQHEEQYTFFINAKTVDLFGIVYDFGDHDISCDIEAFFSLD